jgi:hypothetical protein
VIIESIEKGSLRTSWRRACAGVLSLLLPVLAFPLPAYAQPKAPPPPPLEPVPARLWIVAPAPNGSWTFRLDNEGSLPIRIPADVRLLEFELERADPKNPKRKKSVKCKAPGGLRPAGFPEERALLLAPGESYLEEFDPRLICFGKDASALAGGTVVHARFGWDPPAKGSKKPAQPPFAVQGTDFPPSHAPLRELAAPSMVLSYADAEAKVNTEADPAPPAAPAPPAGNPEKAAANNGAAAPGPGPAKEKENAPDGKAAKPAEEGRPEIVDANAPRLELTTSAHADASAPRRISVTVTATNAGQRPMIAALRARMLSFRVQGPDKTTVCEAAPATHAIPRDRFQTIKPGGSTSFTLLLAEVCPPETFARAGLYRVMPTLHALESGKEVEVSAYTGIIAARAPTIVRVQTSTRSYYKDPPKAVPTPKPAPSENEEE